MRNTIKTLLAAALLTGTAAFAHADEAPASTSAQQQTIVQYTDDLKACNISEIQRQEKSIIELADEVNKGNERAIKEANCNKNTWRALQHKIKGISLGTHNDINLIIAIIEINSIIE